MSAVLVMSSDSYARIWSVSVCTVGDTVDKAEKERHHLPQGKTPSSELCVVCEMSAAVYSDSCIVLL